MKIVVDLDICQRHARCCLSVPEVFELDEAGLLTYHATVDDELRDAVEEAVDGCPTQAIRILD
ncbi:MAG: ferredoxin [Actinomycetota bacterium]|nr:ferredoxin [Actinomycetota bacterium]